ncbi:MAG: HTH domain-containing protein [Candidatus Nanoarchaeia archaeon]|nr:HTH domain-containing protein [Candidatus Nanoarchaeia archaeon]
MANERVKTKEVSLSPSKGGFIFFKKPGTSKGDYDFRDMASIRQFLSNEKARTLHTIKAQNPASIYDLAKKLGRSFKSVDNDVKLLKRLGFIELKPEYSKKRKRLKPVIVVDTLNIIVRL